MYDSELFKMCIKNLKKKKKKKKKRRKLLTDVVSDPGYAK